MGDFKTGSRLARDGKTVLADDNEFGQEWQVRDTDGSLFLATAAPQYPDVCALPAPAAQEKRRAAERAGVDSDFYRIEKHFAARGLERDAGP